MTRKGRVIIYTRGWYRREARYDYTIFPTHVSTMFVNSLPDHLKGCNLTSNPLRKVGIIVMTSKKKNLTKETFWPRLHILKQHFTCLPTSLPCLISCYPTLAHLEFLFIQPFYLRPQPQFEIITCTK